MTDTITRLLTDDEDAWLKTCPIGEARTVTTNVGAVNKAFTVDRRYVPAPVPYLYGPHGTEFTP